MTHAFGGVVCWPSGFVDAEAALLYHFRIGSAGRETAAVGVETAP